MICLSPKILTFHVLILDLDNNTAINMLYIYVYNLRACRTNPAVLTLISLSVHEQPSHSDISVMPPGSYCDLFENHMPLFAINVYLKLLTMNSTRDNPLHSLLVGKHPLTCSDPDSAPTIVMNLAMFKQTPSKIPI